MKFIKKPIEKMGFDFIEPQYLPAGKDEYYLRENISGAKHRELTEEEIRVLTQNANYADDWSNVLVKDGFNPYQVKRTRFKGFVRIGKLENYYLEYHDLKQPVGIYDSTIVSCDLGDNVAINYVSYMAHYQIEDEVILFNVKEIITTAVAKFGNGILKEGEQEKSRIELELGNENGGRSVLPFNGIKAPDIFLWYKFRDDKALMSKFKDFTETKYDNKRGYYGRIGSQTIVKNSILLKDVNIGEAAYINGANKLKNLTINSKDGASTQIGEGVELVNGIIDYGCRIFYGVKAVRFVLGQASQLKYGARLINSYLGDNSTISCCEVLNSLIFPFHEQHHNNSFLCASTLYGQTNLAAGATIGSNHNSRAADGEILAGRGFWPGLCVSLKHNSKFASFILLAKGDFPSELNVQFPFSLVSNNVSDNCLEIMPAYWFQYNMYALARNSWKYAKRDKRSNKELTIEQDYLAPDSVNEIFKALTLIENAVGRAYVQFRNLKTDTPVHLIGRKVLNGDTNILANLDIIADGQENSSRKTRLLKAPEAYLIYKQMIVLYGIKNLVNYCINHKVEAYDAIKTIFNTCERKEFVNLGGSLVSASNLEEIKTEIKNGSINNWDDLHSKYLSVQQKYERDKTCHAIISMLEIMETSPVKLSFSDFEEMVEIAIETQEHIAENTFKSRQKDYQSNFRKMMYDNQEEMDAVIGAFEDNDFIKIINEQTENFKRDIKEVFNAVEKNR